MVMNGSGMANEIIAAVAAITSKYKNIADDHKLGGFDIDTYNNDYWNAVAGAIVAHIQANATATGTDTPGGDSHDLPVA